MSEAELEGIPLSETDRKELYFSESACALPDMPQVEEEFEQNYDQQEYERKIARLIRNARKRDAQVNPEGDKLWSEAIGVLSKEDHYILVMVRQAGISRRPRGDFLKLLAAGFLVVGLLLCLTFVLAYLQIDVSRAAIRYYMWVAAVSAIAIYILLLVVLGRARTNDLLGWIVEKVATRFVHTK